MHLRLPKTLLAFALAALSASASSQNLPPGADCTEIPGTAPVLAAGRIVMVGEIHGTKEMPAEFLRLVCSAVQRGQAVAVGIEMADPGGTLAAYMASTGDTASRQALLKARHWNGMRDGRSSVAWLDMIEAFRTMRQRDLPLRIFALNDKPYTGDRDQAMAARLREEHAAHPDALILTYTGNIHNMLKGMAGLPAPMGALVADMEPVSIGLTSDAGQAWMCTGPNECGATGLPATLENGPPHAARPAARAGVYTLQINVGRITASPPAVP
jgi:hypothetical protein